MHLFHGRLSFRLSALQSHLASTVSKVTRQRCRSRLIDQCDNDLSSIEIPSLERVVKSVRAETLAPDLEPSTPERATPVSNERSTQKKTAPQIDALSTRKPLKSKKGSLDAITESVIAIPAKRKRRKSTIIPPRLLPPKPSKHDDLNSFLSYASHTKLNPQSTVYKGTHYEYIVAQALSAFDFSLHRTGRSNDLGIDLAGHWKIPPYHPQPELPVLVQCKASTPSPSMIRELEGVYVGAPSGWRGDDTLALLVTAHRSTEGVRSAVQRSRWPLGMLHISREGVVRQFLWNEAAAKIGLEGLGVAVSYGDVNNSSNDANLNDGGLPVSSSIALTWLGKRWRMRSEVPV